MSSLSTANLTQLSYLVAAALFILGLKRMSSPVTAVSGVRWAGLGMLLATLATLAFMGASLVEFDAGDRRHRGRRQRRVDQRQARRHDRHAADDRALQRHGRRRGGGDRGGRAVSRR